MLNPFKTTYHAVWLHKTGSDMEATGHESQFAAQCAAATDIDDYDDGRQVSCILAITRWGNQCEMVMKGSDFDHWKMQCDEEERREQVAA